MQRKSVLYLVAALAILVVLLSAALVVSAEKGEPPGALPNSLSISGGALPPAGPIRVSPPQNPDALVNDGSFENGPPPASAWTEVTNGTCEWIGDWTSAWGVPAHDGSIDFWAGGYCQGSNPATSSVSQAGLPVPATDNDLHFWYIAYRPDPDDGDNDRAYVNVNGTPVWTLPLVQASSTYPNWVEVVLPMGAYAGQNVTLEFGGISENDTTGNIRFDYISFGTPPPPPPRCPVGSTEVTVLTQDFEGAFPPAGWAVANNGGDCVWTNTDPGGRGNLTGGTGAFAIADSDECGSGSYMDTELWTPAIDLTGLTAPKVEFKTDYRNAGDYAALDASTDGGTSWANIFTRTTNAPGPLTFISDIPGAGLNNVRVRWHYGNANWAWWWEVDDVAVTACQQNNPAIELNKTVGTTPGVCAVGDNITVSAGTEVYYCYQVENTGSVALNFHDLADSELGTILDNFPYALAPGAFSPQVIVPATPMATVTNVGTWTAYSSLAGYVVDDTIGYDFQDISGTGTALSLSDDEVSSAIPMGFTFDYFGSNYSDMYVSSNGFLTVNNDGDSGCCSGDPIPDPNTPNGVIAGWWTDLYPPNGAIYYQTLGSAPNRVFIVQFSGVPHCCGTDYPVTMQFKLFETTNVIEVHYQAAPSDGGTHSAGIENADGSAGVQWYYGPDPLATPEAVQYAPVPVDMAMDTDTATVTVLIPNIDVNPLSLSSTQAAGTSATLPMTVANTGQGNLMWEITEVEPAAAPPVAPAAPTPFERPIITSSKECGPYMQANAGPLPEGFLQYCVPAGPQPAPAIQNPVAPTDTAYSLELTGGSFFSFPLNNFGAQTGHGTQTRQLFAMDFNADATTMYAIDYGSLEFGTLDLNTAAFTVIGSSTPLSGQSWTGLSIDPLTNQAYASSCNITSSAIYSIDLSTGAATLIGTTTDAPCLIDISISPAGDMYGHDIVTNSIYLVNRNTGAVSLVGPTGYDGNYAQGMDFDNDTGTLYIFLFDLGSFGTIYGTVDLTTGAVTPLAFTANLEYEGAVQNTSFCAALDAPWLSLSPTAGTTAGGDSTPVVATFDSTGLADGTYTAQLCIRSNDPDLGPANGTGLVIVPVTLIVEPATAVTLASLVAGEAQSPLPIPAALPMAALPAVSGLALAAAYLLRRKR